MFECNTLFGGIGHFHQQPIRNLFGSDIIWIFGELEIKDFTLNKIGTERNCFALETHQKGVRIEPTFLLEAIATWKQS